MERSALDDYEKNKDIMNFPRKTFILLILFLGGSCCPQATVSGRVPTPENIDKFGEISRYRQEFYSRLSATPAEYAIFDWKLRKTMNSIDIAVRCLLIGSEGKCKIENGFFGTPTESEILGKTLSYDPVFESTTSSNLLTYILDQNVWSIEMGKDRITLRRFVE